MRLPSLLLHLLVLVPLGLAVLACGELKTGTPAEGAGDGGASSSGSTSSSGASGSSGTSGSSSGLPGTTKKPPSNGFGPGNFGSLPSGYCCTADTECRSRHCEDLGGGKMCLDECRSNSTCTRPPDFTFTCDNGGVAGDEGFCKPTGSFTCIPASTFETGTKLTGACCTATGDGHAGNECAGGRCIAIGDGPFVCTNQCVLPKDCAAGYVCQAITETRKECIPANTPYTCN